ncbi:hypothetical protein M408DRAFT_332143 [Serendipita vermifera MAFF 305830]|uniref:Uncharacterized protein n=1 Tax=Serendipita vermifera MAFF 305830 TaxID=933852 RepID=A0A0C2X2U3_SERVB|nr:hypothetical protein M408DRAFT_332143 [Serendipita vermifera MAFF 305830]
MYNALKEAEDILGLDGFDKPPAAAGEPSSEAAITSNSTPSNNLVDQESMPATPFTADLLAGGNSKITANIKTPAFSFPTNPLGMNVYSTGEQQVTEAGESTLQETSEDLIPPYLRYLRVHTLMLGILWLTHSGESTRSSERLTLLHEMMDKLNDLSKGEGWTSDNESCLISIPLHSNPERPLRIQSTHPRVLYQLTFVISSIAKRDCLGRKPKRKVFAQEVLRISSADDPRAGDGPKPGILDGGSVYDFAPGLGLRDMRYAQRSITHIRATAYYELVAACLIRSEFEEAEQHLADLVSFLRTPAEGQPSHPSMWDQYASRITLLYGHLAHALGQAHRAMECYQTVCFLEKEESIVWCMGKAGEIVLRIGAAALRAEARGKESSVEMTEDQANDQQIWSPEERERLVEAASELVDRCLNSGLGEHMAVVGRVIAASLCAEIVRTKQNLKSGLDMACKGRDNYMRLLVLIFTAGQYLYTHTEYALTILESSRQLASSLGAVTGPIPTNLPAEPNHRQTRSSNTEERFQYHVGHARGGLWIGQRFAELYKRRGESEKAAKQNAVNTVFQKAIDTIDLLGGKVGSPDVISILDEFPLLAPPSQPAVYEAPPANRKRPKVVASTSKSKASKRSYSRETADFSEQSQGTSASYPPSSPDPDSRNRSQRSGASHGKNAFGSHSHSGSIASTASGRSLRSRGERKVIIESDDEEDGQKAMSEDDFEGSELEESDGDVHL